MLHVNSVHSLMAKFTRQNMALSVIQLTFLEFHFETEAKVDFPSAWI